MMDFFDQGLDWLTDIASGIGSAINDAFGNLIGKIMFYITTAVCDLVRAVYSVFSVFAGITKVKINGDYQYLTNFFFQNDAVSGIYWGMVMIGVALVFGFAIVAVIRKIFDLYDKQQHSLGQILTGCFKSILIMVCLTFFMSAAMSLTNELVRRVNYVFDENKNLTKKQEIVFTDEQFATMARIFNTIGNYSLNPSYNERFNLNACYNEIRPDLLILQEQGVFDLIYVPPETAEGGKDTTPSWQGALEAIALAGSPAELMMDPYYPQISKALTDIMEIMRNNADFKPIESFRREDLSIEAASLDRVLFLSGTMSAAHNNLYNLDPSLDDAARGPFLHGDKDKSIYSLENVSAVFDIKMGGISYLLILFLAFFVLRDLWRCLMTCTSRMINIVGLYIIAPPVAAAMPLDDGQKFKEWVTSMVIQMLGIFGAIIPLRLVLLFIPMILDSNFILLESTTANLFGKVALIVGLLEGVDRFGSVLTGILANSAGQAAIRAASMDDESDKTFDRFFGQYVPGMRNFMSDRYQQKQAQQKQSQNQGQGQGQSGGAGGNAANYGINGGKYGSPNGLPSRAPQAASMLSSHLDNVSGGKGGLGDLPGGASALSKLGGIGGNLSGGTGGNLGAKSGTMSGLPGKAPTMQSMNNSPDGLSAGSGLGQSSVPGTLPANEGSSFSGGNEYGGNSYGSNDYGGDSYGGSDFGGENGNLPQNNLSSFGGENGGEFGGVSLPSDMGGNIQQDYAGAFQPANTFGAQIDKNAAAYGLQNDPLSPSIGINQFNNSMTNVQQSGGTGSSKPPIPQKQAPPLTNSSKNKSGNSGTNKKN